MKQRCEFCGRDETYHIKLTVVRCGKTFCLDCANDHVLDCGACAEELRLEYGDMLGHRDRDEGRSR